jgi:hypothetical protein
MFPRILPIGKASPLSATAPGFIADLDPRHSSTRDLQARKCSRDISNWSCLRSKPGPRPRVQIATTESAARKTAPHAASFARAARPTASSACRSFVCHPVGICFSTPGASSAYPSGAPSIAPLRRVGCIRSANCHFHRYGNGRTTAMLPLNAVTGRIPAFRPDHHSLSC